jgi:nucleotide-binding universal stress UspA family protein
MKKILVPTDFSEPGNWAVEVAASIAKKMYAQVTLLHIVELPSAESFNVEGQVDTFPEWEDKLFALKLIDKNKQLLSEAAESLRNQVLL